MDFISVRELRINTGDVWDKLEKEKELIITSNGRPVALMAGITGASLEAILASVRRARGEWAIREMRQHSVQKGLEQISDEEINREIKKTRRERPA